MTPTPQTPDATSSLRSLDAAALPSEKEYREIRRRIKHDAAKLKKRIKETKKCKQLTKRFIDGY
jgi:ElaB/YqjD/DUF883 family membrane-anchored ribosome-binding protein